MPAHFRPAILSVLLIFLFAGRGSALPAHDKVASKKSGAETLRAETGSKSEALLELAIRLRPPAENAPQHGDKQFRTLSRSAAETAGPLLARYWVFRQARIGAPGACPPLFLVHCRWRN